MPDGEIKPVFRAKMASTAVFGRGFLYDLWYFAALSSELKPGKLKRYEMLGEPVLIGRTARRRRLCTARHLPP